MMIVGSERQGRIVEDDVKKFHILLKINKTPDKIEVNQKN